MKDLTINLMMQKISMGLEVLAQSGRGDTSIVLRKAMFNLFTEEQWKALLPVFQKEYPEYH